MARRRPVLALFLALAVGSLASCRKKEPLQPEFAELLPPVGQLLAPICKKENDGRQATVSGYVLLPETVRSSEGRVDVDLYMAIADGAGQGRAAVLSMKEDEHISFFITDNKSAGYFASKGKIHDAKIHAASGDKKPGERFEVTFVVKVVEHFQTHEVTACELDVVAIK